MIFQTERLIVRPLSTDDLSSFFALESNPNVLKYADGNPKDLATCKLELLDLIQKYELQDNDFWIYAVQLKSNANFVGTIAFVKDGIDDEIGYRFIEKYWGKGFGLEMCLGILKYCKSKGMQKIVAYAAEKNIASCKILEKCKFEIVNHFIDDDQQKSIKYEIKL